MSHTSKKRLSNKNARPAQRRRYYQPSLELLEDRCMPSVTGFSTIDQTNNNASNDFGIAGTDLLRLSEAAYKPATSPGGDGLNIASLTYGTPTFIAGPRLVSNVVHNQATVLFGPTDIDMPNTSGLSDFGYTWGQFIDHDMDLTPTLSGKITAATWSAGTASITVADGLFRVGDGVSIKGTGGFNGTFTILTATPPGGPTTFTFALATDPGVTTLGTVANNTTKDGANGFPIPVDTTHDGLPTVGIPGPELVDPIGIPGAENVNLAFTRSVYNTTTGITTPREQINVSTSFLDLSQVYGSTQVVSDALRSGIDGRLKTSAGMDGLLGNSDDLLPFNNLTYFTQAQLDAIGMGNDVHLVPDTALFAAGDPRANETTELTALQTLFLRNHNKIAGQLKTAHPDCTDEQLFQEARKLNIAQYQKITYEGYLPALLGQDALAAYTGYNASVNPAISTEFSTLAFRFGHSQLNNTVLRHDNNGNSVGDLSLAASFFNPTLLTPGGANSTDIDAVLKGDADGIAQENDVYAVSGIRNLLFGQGGQGEDLIARDLWRVDDHGIGDHNQVRAAFGLDPIVDTGVSAPGILPGDPNFRFHGFELLSSDPAVVANLITAFTGPTREAFLKGVDGIAGTADDLHAGNIHPFTASLAEDHVPGSQLGETFHKILVDQFTRLRDGDRFFYLNYNFNAEEQAIISQGDKLGEVIKSNTNITNLQDNVFFDRSVLIYEAPAGGSNVSVVAALGVVTIIDNSNGNILALRSLSSVTRILLVGSNTSADVFNLFIANANSGIENGISVYGGNGNGDRVNVFGRLLQQDTFTVTGSEFSPDVVNVNINGNQIMSSGFETTRLVTLFGNDIIIDPNALAVVMSLWNPLSGN